MKTFRDILIFGSIIGFILVTIMWIELNHLTQDLVEDGIIEQVARRDRLRVDPYGDL